jgi:hypothetical protein
VPILLRIGRSLWKFALGRLQIADMNRFAINYRSSRDPTAVYRPRRSYTPVLVACPLWVIADVAYTLRRPKKGPPCAKELAARLCDRWETGDRELTGVNSVGSVAIARMRSC